MQKYPTPEEHANLLIEKFKPHSYEDEEVGLYVGMQDESSKECALIYVNGMIDEFKISKFPIGGNEQAVTLFYYKADRYQHWLSVKRELEKL